MNLKEKNYLQNFLFMYVNLETKLTIVSKFHWYSCGWTKSMLWNQRI